MRLIELIRKDLQLGDRLRFQYRVLLNGPQILGILALTPGYWQGAMFIARALGLGDHQPVRGHPMQYWAFFALFVLMVVWVVTGCLLGALGLAAGLRFVGWSWRDIRLLLIESEPPSHWLKP